MDFFLEISMLGRLRSIPGLRRGFSDQRVSELEKQVSDLSEKLKLAEAANKAKSGGIRALTTEKGVPFVVWYFAVWAGGIAGFYGLFESEILPYQSFVDFAKSVGAERFIDLDSVNPKTGKLAIAAIANELAEPIRLPLALVTLNPVLRLVGRFRSPRL
jgi:hypothetical protein